MPTTYRRSSKVSNIGMNKLLYTGDQEALFEELDGTIATYFESAAHVKSAASSTFTAKMMKEHVPDDKHFAVHLIGLGASEQYGMNKNGDWWNEPSLKHETGNYGVHTFKQGHAYREHHNSDPKFKIGDVRDAAYNKDMHRGEVVVWIDKRKAEKEYADAKAGKALDWSMAAKVKGDICSICGHFAKRSADYCSDAKNNLTKWLAKRSKFVYVDNVEPKFFDISKVGNCADRIARHLEIMFAKGDNVKSASVNGFLFSDLQAEYEGVCLPDSLQLGCSDERHQAWAVKLAATEQYADDARSLIAPLDGKLQFLKQAAAFAFTDDTTEEQLQTLRKVESSILFHQLAKQAAVLPFKTFFAYVTNQSMQQTGEDAAFKYASAALLPTAMRTLLKTPSDDTTESMFTPASSAKMAATEVDYDVRDAIAKIARQHSILPGIVQNRILTICASSNGPVGAIKNASVTSSAEAIEKAKVVAKAYALYKAAFCNAAADANGSETIDDAALILITYQHLN